MDRSEFIKHPDEMAYRQRHVLNRFNNWRLRLAKHVDGKPNQFEHIQPKAADPIVRTKERALPPLVQQMPQYHKYTDPGNKTHGTYWDPLFNPNMDDELHQVNPEEEPFCAIYADSRSDAANEYTKCRNIATPELWSYVERLARVKLAPEPDRRKDGEMHELPSGFVPPPENPPDLPYFVPRTRNYILPVYYQLHKDPEQCFTMVKQITGDLWSFEEDLRTHLEALNDSKRRILTSVLETDEIVQFRGKHLHEIVDWLLKKGF